MKKYKLIKDLPGCTKGEEIIFNEITFTRDNLIKTGYLEEIQEKPKPKYKCGDYVVSNGIDKTYIKIIDIMYKNNEFHYNTDGMGGYFPEYSLRLPTEEELKIYFR